MCYTGQPWLLIREPNQFSYDNTGVYVAFQIGYANPELAELLASIINDGGIVEAQVTETPGGTQEKPARGANISFTIYD